MRFLPKRTSRAGIYAREVRLAAKTSFQSLEGRGLQETYTLSKILMGVGCKRRPKLCKKGLVCQRRCEPAFGGLPTRAERFK